MSTRDAASVIGGGLSAADLRSLIRTVPDFPAPGIQFRDITTLIADGTGLAATIEHLAAMAPPGISAVAGIEARGFIFGTALAIRLGTGFIPVRKAGKLPVDTIGVDYSLEYGQARIEIDPTLVGDGDNVLLVDDLIATGGTALAAAQLLRQAGALCTHALFVIDLPELGGAQLLHSAGIRPASVMEFAGH